MNAILHRVTVSRSNGRDTFSTIGTISDDELKKLRMRSVLDQFDVRVDVTTIEADTADTIGARMTGKPS